MNKENQIPNDSDLELKVFEFRVPGTDVNSADVIGRYWVEPRIDICSVSRGFAQKVNDLVIGQTTERRDPRLISSGQQFASTSTINIPIQVAAAGRKVLYTDCAVMPYANLMVFDDPDPFDDDSEAGWFDVLFGANYVAAMKHLINEPEKFAPEGMVKIYHPVVLN